MKQQSKKWVREEWNRLKNMLEKLAAPGKPKSPQWAVQPVRTKKPY